MSPLPADLLIRHAEPEDAEGVLRVLTAPRTVRGTLQTPFQSVGAARRRMEAMAPGDVHLVAVAEGGIRGSISLHRETRPRRAHAANLGMAAHDDWQGQGIGTALLTTILDLADNWLGVIRIELTAWHDNHHAIRLYARHGFETEGRLRMNALRDGVLTDSITMARLRLPASRSSAA